VVKKTDQVDCLSYHGHVISPYQAGIHWFEHEGEPITDQTMTERDWDEVCKDLRRGAVRCFSIRPPETKQSLAEEFIRHAARHRIRLDLRSFYSGGAVCARMVNGDELKLEDEQRDLQRTQDWIRWNRRFSDLILNGPKQHYNSLNGALTIAYLNFQRFKQIPEQSPEEFFAALVAELEGGSDD
jgi:hypothetical protein